MCNKLTAAILKRQDDVCSSIVLRLLASNTRFQTLAEAEGRSIIRRDEEDEKKLAKGIDIGIARGILASRPCVRSAIQINVTGRTSAEITQSIIAHLPSQEGNVIIIQGLSGTGKGTTVMQLQRRLPRCVTWSNGNVFRSYTYLCEEMLNKEGKHIEKQLLTEELIASVAKRVTYTKCADGSFQTIIDDTTYVKDIENTLLKTSFINEKVPTVAEQTQGEVIRFGISAVEMLKNAGYNVVLEGRAQTLNYIPTSERFELVIPDVSVLGQRRAAQRVMARALESVEKEIDSISEDKLQEVVLETVETLETAQIKHFL